MMSEPQSITPPSPQAPPAREVPPEGPADVPAWDTSIDRAGVVAEELGLDRGSVERTLALLDDGATLPFIARYRKEVTGGLNEVQIGQIRDRGAYLAELVARKKVILAEINRQGRLTPELAGRILETLSKTQLEDLYLPYKPRRRTRATIAREKGLEPLALLILSQEETSAPREELAAPYISAEKDLGDVDRVFAGARDIIAEMISENAQVRAALRDLAMSSGVISSRLIKQAIEDDGPPEPGNERDPAQMPRVGLRQKKEDPAAKFADYFHYEEAVRTLPSHRVLALRRGEKEGVLKLDLQIDRHTAVELVRRSVIRTPRAALIAEIELAIADAWDRLLKPAIEVDVRLLLRERADAEAIRVFAQNLRNLLLASPLGGRRVLAIDPGYRTGCKIAIIDEKGDFVTSEVIYLTQSEAKRQEAAAKLEELTQTHGVQAIAIGNGTASRETEAFVRRLHSQGRLHGAKIAIVNEAGASVYSASEIGRQELPDKDVTVRGAVSIGRRLQDPLAELVKIEPRSIGVGQYQHDVHQPTLKKQLDQVVESCVNLVGVDVNTASPSLLQYVAGIGETLAQNIVNFRSQNGPFRSRAQLLDVPRLGPKAFEQAAGFLRITNEPEHPLDCSAVHPESYDVVERMAQDLGVGLRELIGRRDLIASIDIARYIDERRGEPTLRDILGEMEKPGRDPRADFEEVGFNPSVTEFGHLEEGMILTGVISNVTNFGAFVDVGVHQDGLVHVSELAHHFVKDPSEVVKVGDRVKVKVVKLDVERRRIGLSIKAASETPKAGTEGAPARGPRNKDDGRAPSGDGERPGRDEGRSGAPPRQSAARSDGALERVRGRAGDGQRPSPKGPPRGGPSQPAASKPFSTPFNQIRIRTTSKN